MAGDPVVLVLLNAGRTLTPAPGTNFIEYSVHVDEGKGSSLKNNSFPEKLEMITSSLKTTFGVVTLT